MRITSKILLLLPMIAGISTVAFAQPLPPDGVPIDPFSWVVLGAGAAIGGKKYYDARKRKKEQNEQNDL